MKTRSKALLLSLCAILLVASTVFGTLAYLTDTDDVENTFTVGRVGISLDEAKVNTNGSVVEGAARVTENEYHLLPGYIYVKDPTIHVDANSEDCWLFVKVDNQIAAIEAPNSTEEPVYTRIADQMTANGWSLVAGTTNIYAYERIATKADVNIVVFEEFKIDGTVDNDTLKAYAPTTTGTGDDAVTTIVVTAYAIQADGFTTAAEAWTAADFAA